MTKNDDQLQRIVERANELKEDSLDWGHAHSRAWFEHLINEVWPEGWGNNLQVLIYGDFNAPKSIIQDARLGITVYPEKLKDTVIRNALCVLRADVSINEKSIRSVLNAIERLNLFLGAWFLTSWGNNQVGWWCYLTHGGGASASVDLKTDELLSVSSHLCDLPDSVRQRIGAALYWLRATPTLVLGHNEAHAFRTYSARWNAFECFVEAVHIYRPEPRASRTEKQQAIDGYVVQRGGRLTAQHIDELYRTVVNPGFVGRAKHALTVCFGEVAGDYIYECFDRPDRNNRFYEIRNAINHGEIDAENPEERIRVESRLGLLNLMLLQLFARIVPYSAPAVEGFTRRVARND